MQCNVIRDCHATCYMLHALRGAVEHVVRANIYVTVSNPIGIARQPKFAATHIYKYIYLYNTVAVIYLRMIIREGKFLWLLCGIAIHNCCHTFLLVLTERITRSLKQYVTQQ